MTADVLDSSRVGIFVLDSDFKIVTTNNALELYFGLQRVNVVGKDKRQLIEKRIKNIFEDHESFSEKVLATYDNNTYIENFECHVLAEGEREERWLEHWSQPIISGIYAGGRIEHYTDINLRKRAEEALRESEEKYRGLVEGLNEAVYRMSLLDGKYEYVSPSVKDVFGYSAEEFINISLLISKIIHPDFLDYFQEKWTELIGGEVAPNYEYKIIDPEGNERWIFQSNKGIFDKRRNIIAIEGICRNISFKKQAEETLRKSEEKYRSLVETINDWIWEVDKSVVYTYSSPKVKDMLGYEAVDVIGKRPFDFMTQDEGKSVAGLFRDIMESHEPFSQVENTNIHKDGHHVILEASGMPVFDSMGNFIGYRGIDRDITDRKRAENTQREERDKAQTYLDIAGVMFVAINIKGEVTLINKKGCEILGYEEEEINGKNWFDNFLPKRLIDEVKPMSELLLAGEIEVAEYYENPILTKHGEERLIAWHNTILRDEKGEIIGHLSSGEDITERKKAEEALRESEERWQFALEGSRDGVWDWNTVTNKVYFSRCWKEMLGYNEDEISNHIDEWNKLVHPDDKEQCYADLNRHFNGETPFYENEHRVLCKDSSYKWILDRGKVISWTEDKKPLRVIGTHTDITDRKRAEEALRESEEKYRSMMEAMKDPVYICSPDYRVEYMNPAMIKRTGHDATGELCFKALHDLHDKCPWCVHDKVQASEHVESDIVSPKDNRSYHVSHSPIVHGDGSISKMTVFIDTTDFIKLEIQLRQAQKMEAIGSLAGGIAHDFNNVLYAIIGYTELSMDAVPEGSKARRNLQEVLKAADRAKDMAQQILTFSRKTEKEKKPISVLSVLKEAVNLIRTSLPSTIEIRQDIDADCGPVIADPTQIHEIIMNLGTNAYHAMREKGGILGITLRQEEIGSDDSKYDLDLHPGSYLKLIVEDTGHGIDSNIMEKIFDPYFTTKGVGEGTGMGLSVVHGIVKDHGGDIRVYSEHGKGTAFHVYLPVIETGTVEREIISAEPVSTGTERILFIDDEEQIVQMVQQILESLGYHVTPRTSSVEALEAFRARPDEFDLVITDMTMPNMTGAELAPKLLEIRSDIPIILCTGFSELMDKNKANAIGIREYVMKPIIRDKLAITIRKVLDG